MQLFALFVHFFLAKAHGTCKNAPVPRKEMNMNEDRMEQVTVMVEAEVISRCGQAMERSGLIKPIGVFLLEAALEKADRLLAAHDRKLQEA